MKKAIVILAILCSINAFSQDTLKTQRLSLGIGSTWGTLGWGANANISYALSKKFSLKVRGVLGANKARVFNEGSGFYFAIQNNRTAFDLSISANYFLIGNTKSTCKAGLYFGLGLGYLRWTETTSYIYANNSFPYTSDQEKYISQGLACNAAIGGTLKLGPGKIYAEGYFAMSFVGNSKLTAYLMNNQFPSQFQEKTVNQGFNKAGILCFNIGYAIPF